MYVKRHRAGHERQQDRQNDHQDFFCRYRFLRGLIHPVYGGYRQRIIIDAPVILLPENEVLRLVQNILCFLGIIHDLEKFCFPALFPNASCEL